MGGNLLELLENCSKDRKQRVVLNGQTSSWVKILAGFRQGSVLEPLLLLIYISDGPNGIVSTCKIFTDDKSLFSRVKDKEQLSLELNNDLD